MTTRSVILSAFGGPEVLAFTDGPTPQPGPGQVLVQTEVSGVNFGDTMTRRGEYLRNQPLTLAPGSEAVGRVVMTGAGAEHLLGRRVAAWIEDGGGYATHVLAASHRVYDVPEDLPAPQVAAVFLQGITAMYALHLFGRVRRGEDEGEAVREGHWPVYPLFTHSRQVVLCMIDLKLARLAYDPRHFDSIVDVIGYAVLLNELR